MGERLKVGIVIDYQNVHMTGTDVFAPEKELHESLIDPVLFAKTVIQKKNNSNSAVYQLKRLEVYRGLPSPFLDPQGNARNIKQFEEWKKEASLNGISAAFTSRPLKYRKVYRNNKYVSDPNKPQEKGVDVLCALAVVSMARSHLFDVVILASRDTDLGPALEEAHHED